MNSIEFQKAKQITEEAYTFAFSMLENYKTMYAFSANKDSPSFRETDQSATTCYQGSRAEPLKPRVAFGRSRSLGRRLVMRSQATTCLFESSRRAEATVFSARPNLTETDVDLSFYEGLCDSLLLPDRSTFQLTCLYKENEKCQT